ncbi:phosphonate transport system ATP-binding protein [Rubritalea squalenifaciens DSM 18772]|uniref:Phosphonate transport system ATP-binding protein n=1 Tax=Rubritalea squalenifaciens DSM 18772 TaxID=1123071 RepID=A0A1M6HQR3_9BACT|nr:ATP-binding cassette domain-containing protein [Rubritalea squalenifaciens]SHJ24493.1 phosphonate transport system ATP-binding protein [Rubritalea squalenifaciens DSM 18772]
MIKIVDAYLNFGSTHALANVNLTIDAGEQIALIGPSGSGKSSLLKVLATEHSLNQGEYVYDDTTPANLPARKLQQFRSNIAYIPQDLALIPNLKVSQNVLLGKIGKSHLPATLKDLIFPAAHKIKSVHSILDEVGIKEKIFHRTDSLSGGQQQRVAIARALYQQASSILADEPVSAVDPSRAHSLLSCLTTLSKKHKLTLISSLHNLDYAREFFPRLIGMRAGRIVFDGSPDDFSDDEFRKLYKLSSSHTSDTIE